MIGLFKSFITYGAAAIVIASIIIGTFIAPVAFAAPGDIVYKPALGKLGQNNPFKVFSNPQIMTVDSTGHIYVSDYYDARIVKMNADGSNPVIIAMTSQAQPYVSTEYSQNNSTGSNINGMAIGENDELYVFTTAGINVFNNSGEYLSFHAYQAAPELVDRGVVTSSRVHYNAASNALYSSFEICTILPSYDCDLNSYQSVIRSYSMTGQLIKQEVYSTSDPSKSSPYRYIEDAGDAKISVITSKEITIFNEDLSIDSTQVLPRSVQAVHHSAQGQYRFTYSGENSPLDTETFTVEGDSVGTGTISTEVLQSQPLQTQFDTTGNRYEFEGDYAVRSFTKYSGTDQLVFNKNETPELGTFAGPGAIAVDSQENTYVYDSCSVQKFSDSGTALFRFGKNGSNEGDFSCGIRSIGIDKNDNVIVYDSGVGKLIVFSSLGQYIRTVDVSQEFYTTGDTPAGDMYVDHTGKVFLLGYKGVMMLSSEITNPQYIRFKNVPETLSFPNDFVVDRKGNFYLLDPTNAYVVKFDSTGEYLLLFGGPGESDETLGLPYAIAVDLPGNVYVSDIRPTPNNDYSTVIKRFSSDGEFLLKFGSAEPSNPLYMNSIGAIIVNNDYGVYAMDQYTTEVKRYEIEKNDSSIISADGRRVIDNPAISKQPTFAGSTEPYAKVTVTVHSDPVSCTADADAFGNWSCSLPTELPEGQHTLLASVALADNTSLELGPYPVHVIGVLGTPGTTLSEGLLAPNTGLLTRSPLIFTALSTMALLLIVGSSVAASRYISRK